MAPDDNSKGPAAPDGCVSNFSPKAHGLVEHWRRRLRANWSRLSRTPSTPFEGDPETAQWLEAQARRLKADRATAAFRSVYRKRNPLVSVCIATADRPDVLARRALASVSRQTYENLEVIVVGDNCDHRTGDVIRAVGDPRITYVNLPTRGPYPPPGYARWLVAGTNPVNEALRRARGDFLTHLDEDDTFAECRIAELVDAIRTSGADLVFHPFWWEHGDRSWVILGDGTFSLGQTGTGMVLYHRWFAQIPWNVYAYRLNEPGDWNRFRKFVALGARCEYVDYPLTWHWHFPRREPFARRDGETFLCDDENPIPST